MYQEPKKALFFVWDDIQIMNACLMHANTLRSIGVESFLVTGENSLKNSFSFNKYFHISPYSLMVKVFKEVKRWFEFNRFKDIDLIEIYKPHYFFVWHGLVYPPEGLKTLSLKNNIPVYHLERGFVPGYLGVDPKGINGGSLGGNNWHLFLEDHKFLDIDNKDFGSYIEKFRRKKKSIVIIYYSPVFKTNFKTIKTIIEVISEIHSAFVVIMRNFSVGLEALLYNKPVICLGNRAYPGKGFAIDIADHDRLYRVLADILKDRNPEISDKNEFYCFLSVLLNSYHSELNESSEAEERNRKLLRNLLVLNGDGVLV